MCFGGGAREGYRSVVFKKKKNCFSLGWLIMHLV